jgi:hypothetical protein
MESIEGDAAILQPRRIIKEGIIDIHIIRQDRDDIRRRAHFLLYPSSFICFQRYRKA